MLPARLFLRWLDAWAGDRPPYFLRERGKVR